jgi:uncharacterized protein (DUF2236 family)
MAEAQRDRMQENPLRRMLIGQVRAVFHDSARGQTPVVRSVDALHPPGSVIWRVHGDVTTMMIGGVAALLLQMLHPAALAGVWDHSTFRDDMLGRLRRTARFIAVTTYGERSQALAAIARVRQVHGHVRCSLQDGTPYAADDPRLLAWVHVCEAIGFLDAWIAFGEPAMTRADQDTYFAQSSEVARALGAAPVPQTRAEADALLAGFQPELAVTARTREVARLILNPPSPTLVMAPAQAILTSASVAILPRWAKRMHRLETPLLAAPLVRAAAFGMAGTLRWAFGQSLPRVVKN